MAVVPVKWRGKFPHTSKAFNHETGRMERSDLLELHKRNGDRPQFYREHRDAFETHLSDTTAAKLPDPDASTFEWRQFIESHKGTITRQLNDAEDGTDPTDDAEETEVSA